MAVTPTLIDADKEYSGVVGTIMRCGIIFHLLDFIFHSLKILYLLSFLELTLVRSENIVLIGIATKLSS